MQIKQKSPQRSKDVINANNSDKNTIADIFTNDNHKSLAYKIASEADIPWTDGMKKVQRTLDGRNWRVCMGVRKQLEVISETVCLQTSIKDCTEIGFSFSSSASGSFNSTNLLKITDILPTSNLIIHNKQQNKSMNLSLAVTGIQTNNRSSSSSSSSNNIIIQHTNNISSCANNNDSGIIEDAETNSDSEIIAEKTDNNILV